jgi:hypothetical protein
MSQGNRHFASVVGTNEEVAILGYRSKTGSVLVCYLSALPQSEAQALRNILQGPEAQGKDFLMDSVSGSVLEKAHHPSAGRSWQEHLIRLAASRNQTVRQLTLKDLNFYDATQKAYFSGYGPSIEPDIDRLRKARIIAQDAQIAGRSIPEPSQEQINQALASLPPATASSAAVPTPAAAPAPSQTDAIVGALAMLAQSQQAMMEMLSRMNGSVPAPTSTPTPVAAAPTPVAAPKAAKPPKTPGTPKRPYTRRATSVSA